MDRAQKKAALAEQQAHDRAAGVYRTDQCDSPTEAQRGAHSLDPATQLASFWARLGLTTPAVGMLPLPGLHPGSNSPAWTTDADVPPAAREMWDFLKAQAITDDEKTACLAAYQNAVSMRAPLRGCAACGIRAYAAADGPDAYTEFVLSALDVLRLTADQEHAYSSAGEYKNVRSVFPHGILSAAAPERWHLHPELVSPPAVR